MSKKLIVTLDWSLWLQTARIPNNAGIYMIVAKKNSDYTILDIGQSGESGPRLYNHDRKDCWDQKKQSRATLQYRFAPMSSKEYNETDRRAVECCLRANIKPPCGQECNTGYNRTEQVAIHNIGSNYPLKDKYECSK